MAARGNKKPRKAQNSGRRAVSAHTVINRSKRGLVKYNEAPSHKKKVLRSSSSVKETVLQKPNLKVEGKKKTKVLGRRKDIGTSSCSAKQKLTPKAARTRMAESEETHTSCGSFNSTMHNISSNKSEDFSKIDHTVQNNTVIFGDVVERPPNLSTFDKCFEAMKKKRAAKEKDESESYALKVREAYSLLKSRRREKIVAQRGVMNSKVQKKTESVTPSNRNYSWDKSDAKDPRWVFRNDSVRDY